MRRRGVALAVVALVAPVIACGALIGVSDHDLVTDGGAGDGGTDAVAAGDATAGGDAGADAGSDERALPNPLCTAIGVDASAFCDGFEDDAGWLPRWRVDRQDADIFVTTTRAAHGNASLDIGFGSMPDGGGAALEDFGAFSPPAPSRVSARWSVYLNDSYPDPMPHVGFTNATGGYLTTVLESEGTDQTTMSVRAGGGAAAGWTRTFAIVPHLAFHCLELELDVPTHHVRGWLDRDKVFDATDVDPALAQSFDRVRVGLSYLGAANPTNSTGLLIDDVIIANGAVGCP